MGNLPDKEIARRIGKHYKTVWAKRVTLGIPNRHRLVRVWTKADDALLGTASDAEIARKLGASRESVYLRRSRRGIASNNPKYRLWTAREDRLVGRFSDEETARRLEAKPCSPCMIGGSNWAARCLTPKCLPGGRPPTRRLGTMPDEELAQRLKRTVMGVRSRRQLHKLLRLRQRIYWTEEQNEIVRQCTIKEAARRLNRSLSSVSNQRFRLGATTMVERDTQPWTAEETALLGTAPDEEVARKLGRSVPSVRGHRHYKGIAGFVL